MGSRNSCNGEHTLLVNQRKEENIFHKRETEFNFLRKQQYRQQAMGNMAVIINIISFFSLATVSLDMPHNT